MLRPATPGTLLVLVAAILLVLVTVSTPVVQSIYFLEATIGGTGNQRGRVAHFGTLGYCIGSECSDTTLGYEFDPNQLLGITIIRGNYTTPIIKALTYTLILHPIALGFAVVSFILGLISHCRELSTNCFGTFVTSVGAFVTLVAFGLDLALFVIAKKRIDSVDGASASLGNAIWMTLAAWILMLLAGCAFSCGICGRRRRNRVKDSALDSYGARTTNDRHTEQMRMDALNAENDRKRRQETYDRGQQDLPKFAEYETEHQVPLTNDYDDGAYGNRYNNNSQIGTAYSTNNNLATGAGAVAGGVAAGSLINGVGQGYGRRQATPQQQQHEQFANSPPMLNNTAGYGAHNAQSSSRQNTMASSRMPHSASSPPPRDGMYTPGVGPQPYRDGMEGSALSPAPRSYPNISNADSMTDNTYASGQQQYDSYGNVIPSSQFAQQHSTPGDYGHSTDYSGATFGQSGSRMIDGGRNMPSQQPQEIAYNYTGTTPAHQRHYNGGQGSVNDGFGIASASSHLPQSQDHTGYDEYASAYDHNQAAEHEDAEASGSGFYDDSQSQAGPPGYESVAGSQRGHNHSHYPREKS